MRDAKSRELQKDIEIMSQTFERIIDRKDSVIKALVKDLQEAEEQYSMAMRSHFQNVDNLIDLHNEELEAARNKYQNLIQEIKIEFDKEKEYIHERHAHEINELTTIIYGMEKNYLDQETRANIDFISAKDELKTKVSFSFLFILKTCKMTVKILSTAHFKAFGRQSSFEEHTRNEAKRKIRPV